ncbi:bifunctional diaminohydroxyphosphoribosylaminopyrimidine deaminase/5-amino-6-(5-phosphoribosylamino)uracil reductase RibD [Costertonia aggregata]|uniref:Riboflavin biosynthesis protein RibD n=1 Tax=Costertonia aggregata TaxID=343403 RepID=A0A7H9AKJ4_9FLAO|nr:bifunctional diaminohydroxyphosphoribosylaminopyrimidine deaminase/5-amino-6-(5-phosphoribosylamino)uracil reductase RibD [Costertonia aggregata]QLG43863.1 bifunctional diaminohydroxyphosphoribosylaminopyrimidine deaminase/5-amino-6-(5-phosphoribosylamino)uracil reductase RibD [Costertonia aggregata]
MNIHEKYILRCIEIAQNGLGYTAPNPMVGAVIVHNEKIIGEGYTSAYGGPHAEVNAINSVGDISVLSKATLYVTLEPCSHHGKTPPCTDLIGKHKIPKVVVGILDPNPLVAGKGIEKLRSAGCEVTTGILKKTCREHHKRFLRFQENKRPYIILKWAQSSDGFLAPDIEERKKTPQPYWISNMYSKQLVHKWRSEEQSILVGTNTVMADNPRLNVRDWTGKNPFRVIIDRTLKIDAEHHVMDKSIGTLILTETKNANKYVKGINYEIMDFSKPLAEQIANILWQYNFTSLLVEGGSKTLQNFIDENLWDEARVFIGKPTIKKGIQAPDISGKSMNVQQIGTDILKTYRND